MTVTTTLTGGDVLAESLLANGVDTIFALPGVQLDGAFDALARRRDQLHVLQTRHEQGAAYMALGYALATGRVGTCLVVPGPGLLNAMAALSTANACSAPVLCLTGQIASRDIGKGYGRLHEIPYQLEATRSVAKWAARAMSHAEIADAVREAFRQLRTGRPAPVEVEVPPDVLLGATSEPLRFEGAPISSPALPEGEVAHAATLLRDARRPLLVAGGGVLRSGAWDELRRVAERLGAPVLLTQNALGAMDVDHPLAVVPLGGRRLLGEADVVLAVGTRFADNEEGRRRVRPGQTLIRVDVWDEELRRGVEPEIAIEGDARRVLAALLDELGPGRPVAGWEGIAELKQELAQVSGRIGALAELGGAIRRATPDETVFVSGMTQIGYWSRYGFPVHRPRTFLSSGYQGTLGFEYPTGLGAQVGRPDTRVVVLTGDGGFLFNAGELATAVQHRIPAIVMVFDDGAYGNVKRMQQQQFGREIASDLRNPDFLHLAQAFDMKAFRARTPEEVESALREAQDWDGPVLIHVPVPAFPDPWTFTRTF
ncbi:MAG: thiamine pyrophosphate-binding protein [Candidatus Dormibacteraeota bacterium]|nr:thiamine pyrophosphate-binding protein [Candidatus Dormibacteraeota bacterium]